MVSSHMQIGSLTINYLERPKIIAEIGINHGGCLDTAKKMAELAIIAGADIIKTQLHIPSAEMSDAAKKIVPSHCDQSIYQIMEECALPIDKEYELKLFIESLGGIYLSTPFSIDAAHVLGQDFGVSAFKIGSGECTNYGVLEAAMKYDKPLIISTGMNSLQSCRETYTYVRSQIGAQTILMHTTNLYPTPPELVRLGGVSELQEIAGQDFVGLSDHTTSNLACLGAVALGAVILERHFTDTKDRQGPDIANSMDPLELRELRTMSEQMSLMRGGSKIDLLKEEDDTRNFAFATLVAAVDISKGSKIEPEMFVPKRPSLGDFMSKDLASLIGQTLKKDIRVGDHLKQFHL